MSKKMKILVISQHYKPEPFRLSDICEELVKRGHDVTVVTGVPNYPEGYIYEKYKRGKNREETLEGVKIYRSFTIGRRKNIIFRFLNYYSFALSSTLNSFFGKYGTDYDVVLVSQTSPVMMSYAGVVYKMKYKKNLAIYCLDLWPESLLVGGVKKENLLYKYYQKVAKVVYKSADELLITSGGFSTYLQKKFGIKEEKISYLPQYAEDLFAPNFETSQKKSIDLVFAGNIGTAQGLELIIEAASILEKQKSQGMMPKDELGEVKQEQKQLVTKKTHGEESNAEKEKIKASRATESEHQRKIIFHLVGDGSEVENLKKEVERRKLDNVVFHGRKPLEEMPKYYNMADAMLVMLKDYGGVSLTLPGKVQTYMASGKPIIASLNGEAKRVIKDANCGYTSKAEDVKDFVKNIHTFAKLSQEEKINLGKNARRYYEEHFSKEKVIEKLESHLEKLSARL